MKTLLPPQKIEDDVFAFIWDPSTDIYILALRDGRTYEIGSAQDSVIYFRNIGMEEIGQRCIDCSRNFYTAIAVMEGPRVFGAETEDSCPAFQRYFPSAAQGELLVV